MQAAAQAAVEAVVKASRVCEAVRTGSLMQAIDKADSSPVTVADYAAQVRAPQLKGKTDKTESQKARDKTRKKKQKRERRGNPGERKKGTNGIRRGPRVEVGGRYVGGNRSPATTMQGGKRGRY